jgi:hypothetical protein
MQLTRPGLGRAPSTRPSGSSGALGAPARRGAGAARGSSVVTRASPELVARGIGTAIALLAGAAWLQREAEQQVRGAAGSGPGAGAGRAGGRAARRAGGPARGDVWARACHARGARARAIARRRRRAVRATPPSARARPLAPPCGGGGPRGVRPRRRRLPPSRMHNPRSTAPHRYPCRPSLAPPNTGAPRARVGRPPALPHVRGPRLRALRVHALVRRRRGLRRVPPVGLHAVPQLRRRRHGGAHQGHHPHARTLTGRPRRPRPLPGPARHHPPPPRPSVLMSVPY